MRDKGAAALGAFGCPRPDVKSSRGVSKGGEQHDSSVACRTCREFPSVAHLIGHWPALRPLALLIGPGSAILLLSVLFIHDRLSQGRIHPVSLWGGVVSIAWTFLFFILIAPTSAWKAVAAWIVGSR
jgi:hypothetical protein